jgi:hypothetical protein
VPEHASPHLGKTNEIVFTEECGKRLPDELTSREPRQFERQCVQIANDTVIGQHDDGLGQIIEETAQFPLGLT